MELLPILARTIATIRGTIAIVRKGDDRVDNNNGADNNDCAGDSDGGDKDDSDWADDSD